MSKALSSCFCHLIGNIPLGIQKSQSVNNFRLHWTPRHQARICLWALDREKSSLHASESVDNALCSLSRPYRIIFTMSETRNFVHYPVIAIICKKTTLIARLLMSVCWAISFNFFLSPEAAGFISIYYCEISLAACQHSSISRILFNREVNAFSTRYSS